MPDAAKLRFDVAILAILIQCSPEAFKEGQSGQIPGTAIKTRGQIRMLRRTRVKTRTSPVGEAIRLAGLVCQHRPLVSVSQASHLTLFTYTHHTLIG